MKYILTAAILGMAVPASAATILYDFDTNSPSNIFGGSYVTSGSIPGVQAATPNGKYLNTIGTGGFYFDTPIFAKKIQFNLGSPDNYNSFKLLGANDTVLYSRQIFGNGNPSVFRTVSVNTKDLDAIYGMLFESGKPAMEVDNIRAEGVVSAIVPEPEMWAMLVAGFGLVGFSMRRNEPKIKTAYN